MKPLGRSLFWITWPLIWLYAPLYLRPRILVICGDEFLAVKPYFGSGEWQLPGGGIHSGESEKSAAVRELAEETNLKVDEAIVTLLLPATRYIEKGVRKRYSIFYVEVVEKSALRPQKNEIGEVAWLPTSIIRADFAFHVTAALQRLQAAA